MPHVLRHDVWEVFDTLDRARQGYMALELIWTTVAAPDGNGRCSEFQTWLARPARKSERGTCESQILLRCFNWLRIASFWHADCEGLREARMERHGASRCDPIWEEAAVTQGRARLRASQSPMPRASWFSVHRRVARHAGTPARPVPVVSPDQRTRFL
jgi:hypothetical protein